MSTKLMDVISGTNHTAPVYKVPPNPRNRPMYGRPGMTIGQHLEEFADFKDDMGRSFYQLVCSTLHGGTKPIMSPPFSKMRRQIRSPSVTLYIIRRFPQSLHRCSIRVRW
ncbi:hypothetical protein EJ02DRAFT_469013 [Clathrospora elynae]|uniref:Uncharacterized protein n=1 Tax=Clathrospora elynae TaxID=706981 RepID=A0A6A5SE67_9PLEO|nr:hypothetical protein EJ02DRAFT_469013 [Clathrospora elynae]